MSRSPRLALVVAAARNGVIGVNGALAWRISDDLKWFKQVTMGKPIIMGRKTWDSIGRPLPGRTNIVVTRNSAFSAAGAQISASLDDAVSIARDAAAQAGVDEICIIGGAQLYRAALVVADRIYFTEVDAAPQGDVWFPQIDPGDWRRTLAGGAQKSDKNDHDCTFVILDRHLTDVTCA